MFAAVTFKEWLGPYMSSISQLRREVMAKQRNAGKKLSRMKSTQGLDLAGTDFDPRRPSDKVAKYNTRQLNALSRKLDEFNDRKHGYVALRSGMVTRQEWAEFKKEQTALNRAKREQWKKSKDVFIDPLGLRREDAQEFYTGNRPTLGAPMEDVFSETNRKPKNIASPEAFKQIREKMRNVRAEGIKAYSVRTGRDQAYRMAIEAGMTEAANEIANMPDDKFFELWNSKNGFANALSIIYIAETQRKEFEANPDLDEDSPGAGLLSIEFSGGNDSVMQWINWAKKL